MANSEAVHNMSASNFRFSKGKLSNVHDPDFLTKNSADRENCSKAGLPPYGRITNRVSNVPLCLHSTQQATPIESA